MQIVKRQLNKNFFIVLMVIGIVFGVNLFNSTASAAGIFVSSANRNGSSHWDVFKTSLLHPFTVNDASDLPLAGDSGYGAGEGDNADNTGLSSKLVIFADKFLMWTVSDKLYDEVLFSVTAREGITMAWETVRGFINMFYLLILLFLAVATILRINNFSDKKLFFNVIVSAILVNFSMPITIAVIDFSNILMVYFGSAIQGVSVASQFLGDSNYAKLLSEASWSLKMGTGTMEFIINIILAVMLFFTGIALLTRLIAYWVLIILSPLAFFSIALPGSNGFREWRDKLMYYSFFGPIMLFFIWLALALSAYLKDAFMRYGGATDLESFVQFFTSYIVVLYLLYYGHDKSKSMASKAGDFAGKIMTKGGDYAVKAGKGAALVTPLGAGYAVGRGIGRKVESEYEATSKAFKSRLQENKWTEGFTKEGRESKQERKNLDREISMAGNAEKESRLKNRRAEMVIKEMEKDGLNIQDDGKLEEIIDNKEGKYSQAEQEAAVAQLSKLGKLKGDRLAKATKVLDMGGGAETNAVLYRKLLASAGENNQIALAEHHAKNYDASDPKNVSTKYMDELAEVYEKKTGVKYDLKTMAKNGNTDRMRDVAVRGMLVNKTAVEQAKLLNQVKGDDVETLRVAKIIKAYHMDNRMRIKGGAKGRVLTDREKNMFNEIIENDIARTELTGTLAVGSTSSSSSGSGSGSGNTGGRRWDPSMGEPKEGDFYNEGADKISGKRHVLRNGIWS